MVHAMRLLLLTAPSLYSATTQAYVINIRSISGDIQETFDIPSSNLTAESLNDSQPVRYRQKMEKPDSGCIANAHVNDYFTKIGDGNPRQYYKIAQIADTFTTCPGTVSSGESHTSGWSFSLGFNSGPGNFDFANLGFSVVKSDTLTVSHTFECNGTMSDICALHNTGGHSHCRGLLTQKYLLCGKTREYIGRGEVYLPNANGLGSTISRGVNVGGNSPILQCKRTAAREVHWYCGPKGGPEWFNNRHVGPWTSAYLSALDLEHCEEMPWEAFKFI